MSKSKLINLIFSITMLIYFILLAKILFFKYISFFQFISGHYQRINSVSLEPFFTISNYYSIGLFNFIANMNILGNIVIFVPMGIFISLYSNRERIINGIFYCLCISVIVEVIQFIFGIGITDIDDIILNTVGGFIGIAIYKILMKVFKDKNTIKISVSALFFLSIILFEVYISYLRMQGYRIKIF